MPITKSAEKALKSSLRKKAFNNHRKTIMNKAIKKFNKLISADQKKEAQEVLPEVYKAIDKAAKRGIIKKNTANRRKSKIARSLN